jgi:hypothetical protein
MGHRLLAGFLALMALKISLLNKLLCLTTQAPDKTIDENLLLVLLNWPPFGTDVDSASNTYFIPTLSGRRRLVQVVG